MEIARGTASHCQNTNRVSGGSNGAVTTTYVALFRLGRRQVQFSSGSPLSISDGDEVIVAGHPWRGALTADAVRNVTTGLTRQSGIVSRVIVALLLLVIGVLFPSAAAGFFGPNGRWIYLGFVAGAVFLLWRAVQTGRAWSYVKSAVS